ncbi:MAG: hypothetical protein QW825_01150 [Candidatus Bathyarchaeia archaeon]
MVFYIVYRASRECKNRGALSKRLRSLGCKRVCSSFWEVNERRINDVLKVVGDNQPILLKRTRDIRKPAYDDEGNIIDFGSLVVVAYNSERDDSGRVRSLLARTPYIRLCRSVYAFCQNSHQYDKRGEIFDMSHLLTLMRESDKDMKVLSRIVIVNSAETKDMLLESVKMRILKRVEKILSGYRNLTYAISEDKMEIRNVIEEERRLRSEFIALRRMAIFYERWLKLDLAKDLMRVYSAIRKLHLIKVNAI